MKKKINSIIFDLDGTLIDSGPDLLDSLNFVLKKVVLCVSCSCVAQRVVAVSLMESLVFFQEL